MTTRSTRLAALTLLLAAYTSACGGGSASPNGEAAGGGNAGKPGGGGRCGMGGGMGGPGSAARVTPVQLGAVTRGSIARTATVSGTVEPIRTIGVDSLLAGALLAVLVQVGARVRAGQALARLDDREISAQLAAAEASFQVAEAAFQRSEQLRERKVITVPEYERDRTAYAAAKSQLDQLRTRAGYATVRAPIAGVITEKLVESGDVVSTNARLFNLADISSLVVRAGVSELDVVELKTGGPVTLQLDALPGRELTGHIRRIFPSGDPTTRLVPVEVVIDPASAALVRPGFLARVEFALSTHDNVLLIPASALIGAQGNEAVFSVQDGKAVRRTVETGLDSRGMVEIRNGLNEGEQIVVVGGNTLRDGMTVRAVGADGGPAPGGADPAGARPGADAANAGGGAPASPRGGAR
ncbi:MAG: efflux RND transporter periplasmic adaptor subunit [Gemmatimonadetes bacterium]|nr:efflux RND transporter periplasmic adaptor subunit [Gemmatimonadota bacterium]